MTNLYEQIRTNKRAAERQLREAFGGRWIASPGGSSGASGLTVAAQFGENAEGRMTLTGLVLLGDAITADQLRKVPIAALENAINLSHGFSFRRLDAEKKKLPPLRREPGMSGEDFSRLVAEHYRMWARYVPHAAAAMAVEWNVKPPTMAGWIREARLRGFLPPASRRKGGTS